MGDALTRYAVTAAVILALGCSPAYCATGTLGPYEPASGCYIGAYIELDGHIKGDVEAFQELAGKPHATFFRYVGYGQPFPFEWARSLKAAGVVPHIAWEPNHGLSVVRDDDYLRGWAEAARHAGVPIFLRYASEMNGTWQAYSGNPAEYIKKWRLVYRVIKQTAPNVVMVWCPFATPRPTIPSYYPGDEYVDWVGVNIYSVVHQDGDLTKPPTEDPVALLSHVYNLYADRKPIAICEYGATHYCRAEQKDVTDFAVERMSRLYTALVDQFPRVRMINWFSVDAINDNLADNNYSLTDNQRVLELYRSLISGPHFLSAVVDSSGQVAVAGEGVEAPIGPVTSPPAATVVPATTSWPLAADDIGPLDLEEIWVAVLGAPPHAVTGIVEIAVEVPGEIEGATVTISIDGRFCCITNVAPYRYRWDARHWQPGEHKIEVEVTEASGRVAGRKQVCAIVVQESRQ